MMHFLNPRHFFFFLSSFSGASFLELLGPPPVGKQKKGGEQKKL